MAVQLDQDVDIALIGARTFNRICQLEGHEPILFWAVHSEVEAQISSISETPIVSTTTSDSSTKLPREYLDFADVFDKKQSEILPKH